MKNKITLGTLLVSTVLLVFGSCKKDPPENCSPGCNHDTSFEAMKEWCYFDEGSWWVYEEENSGDIDSVYVDYTIIDDDSEAFEYGVHSTWYDNDFNYRHNPNYLGGSNVSSCQIRRLHRTQSSPGNFVGGGLIANFPPIEGETSGDQAPGVSDGILTVSADSMLTLSSETFDSTLYFTVGISGSEDFQPLNIFMAKHIGLVRKELPDENRYWNLIDYYIIQ